MKKFLKFALAAASFCFAGAVFSAEDLQFKFEIPPLPYPPVIKDIQYSSPIEGAPSFTVYAQIEASEQKKGYCYVNNVKITDPDSNPGCQELSAWRQEKNPDISPNPPAIKKVLLYYYYNDESYSPKPPITMIYDSVTKLYTANVPIDPGLGNGDTITFYIVALDHYGNVTSQVPDNTMAPCTPGTTSWDAALSTPAWETCSQVTQYEECSVVKNGTPTCSSSYTVNDRLNDVCGEPDTNGNQALLANQTAKTDIHGISAGADSSYLCIRMGLGAAPPPTSDSPPIEGYIAVFFNPDMPDTNPGDSHMENMFAITYAPEAAGSDPTLVRVLWDGDCVSDPNTADPLGCKIKAAIPGDMDLSMGYADSALLFITKKSWGSKQLIGSSQKLAQIIGVTGEINLSGDNLFWLADMSSSLGFYNTKTTVPFIITDLCMIAGPLSSSAECNPTGETGSGTSVCQISTPKSSGNDCLLSFFPSPDKSFIGKYKIYATKMKDSITDANRADYYIGEVAEDGSASYTYKDSITGDDLDGYTRYYKITSVHKTDSSDESCMRYAASVTCVPEDVHAPSPVTITSCATPVGNTEKLKISWTSDAGTDSSITGFYVMRDGTPLFVEPLSNLATDYTDTSDITNGATYTYSVLAVDRGGNLSPEATIDCTPEDKEPPADVTGVIAVNKSSTGLKAVITWNPNSENDLAGYRVYLCEYANMGDCSLTENFTKISGESLLTDTTFEYTGASEESTYIFYVEAVDTSGNAGDLPCFSCTGKVYLWLGVDACRPSHVDTGKLKAESLPEGGKCKITWDKVCTNANPDVDCPATFDCNTPPPEHLIGYYLVMTKDDCTTMPYPYDGPIILNTWIVIASGATDRTIDGLTNGQKYCFLPFSVDGSGNYPPPPAPEGVSCVPEDKTKPEAPVMSKITWDDLPSCIPEWEAVSDPDGAGIKYSLYRCEGALAECASETDFTSVEADMLSTKLKTTDSAVSDGVTYTYAITAKDLRGNESAIVGTENRIECKPGTIPPPPPIGTDPPASANTTPIADNSGCKFWFTASPDDDGVYAAVEGYKIYLCSGASVSTCESTPISTRSGCADDAAPGALIQDVCNNSVTGFYGQYNLSADKEGTWYAGITYSDAEGESDKRMSTSSCLVATDCPQCVDVITVPIKEIDCTVAGKFTETVKSGLKVELVDQADGSVMGYGVTKDDGTADIKVNPSKTGGKTLRAQIRIPAADATGMICDETADDCIIYIGSDISGYLVIGAIYTVNKTVLLPKPGVCGKKEIGNADCDCEVGFGDFKELKKAYKKKAGEDGYLAWADFNNDGEVNFDDFKILKNNYKKKIFNCGGLIKTDPNLCKP